MPRFAVDHDVVVRLTHTVIVDAHDIDEAHDKASEVEFDDLDFYNADVSSEIYGIEEIYE